MILKEGKRTPLMLQCLNTQIYTHTHMYPSGLVVAGHVVHAITYNPRTLKPLTVWIITNCGKFLKRWKYQTPLPASWDICMQVKKHQLELHMEQWTGSKLGKEYIKAAYCHPSYLAYMQSTSWEMLGWMKHKLKSRFLGEISINSDMQMTPPLQQKVKN